MLTNDEVLEVKKSLDDCQKPLFIFHDDPDGLASFLLFYRYKQAGRGVAVKAHPHITTDWLRRVEECNPDIVFILDIALVDQEFIDGAKVPVCWIDHHIVQKPKNCQYYNSRHQNNANICTPVMCWQVMGKDRPNDLWIATVGSIGDWYYPPYAEEFKEKYPDLLPKEITAVDDAYFSDKSKLSKLIKIFSFCLKGPTKDVNTNIKVMTRIDSPYELLSQETSRARLIMKHYSHISKAYDALKDKALKNKAEGKIFVFTYQSDELSLTKDLANELLYINKDKLIILGREKMGEFRCSVRAPKTIVLEPILSKALIGVQGYGGGHEHAWGLAVKTEDWKKFLEQLTALV